MKGSHLRRRKMIQDILQVVVLLIRTSLAAVLIAAGAAKLADISSFATTLVGLGLPARRGKLLRALAFITPLIEVGLGLALVSGLWPAVANSPGFLLLGSISMVAI